MSLIQFKGRVRQEVSWVIPGFLTKQNTAFIMGQPKKAGKSWLLLGGAWSLSEGEPMWGIEAFTPAKKLRTVYFTQEDTEDDVDDRIKAHLGSGKEPNDRLWIVPKNLNIKLDTVEGRNLVQRELDAVADQFLEGDKTCKKGVIDLVIFDPMRRIHNGNENDSETIAEIWGVIDRIHKRYDCATIIAHHTVKPPSDKSNYDPTDPFTGRGSGDIYGGGDAFAVVVPGPMAADTSWRRVTVHFESKRAKQMTPAVLKIHFGTGRIEWLGEGMPA